MTEQRFRELIGTDTIVRYLFFKEIQRWSMKNFYIDSTGIIKHNRLPLIIDVFIRNVQEDLGYKGDATHG